MLVTATRFADFALAVHITAVVITFGVLFAYPVFVVVGARLDPRAMPWFHRIQKAIAQRLVNPGLLIVLVAGIALASNEHQWKYFYVQWGIGAVVVLGALVGSVIIRDEGKLAELAERDVKAAAGSQATWSAEYQTLQRRALMVGGLVDLIVVVTIFFMALHLGR
jgi:hypothetical protein